MKKKTKTKTLYLLIIPQVKKNFQRKQNHVGMADITAVNPHLQVVWPFKPTEKRNQETQTQDQNFTSKKKTKQKQSNYFNFCLVTTLHFFILFFVVLSKLRLSVTEQ